MDKRKDDPKPVEKDARTASDRDREARRAAALRANLRKRKTQQRNRADDAGHGGD